jgi:hypothetical protein
MKMNLNLTITDEQRNVLACLLAGKDVKRLATRDDVAGYVLGMLAGLFPRETHTEPVCSKPDCCGGDCERAERSPEAQAITEATQRRGMSAAEARKYAELIAAGHPPGYARGWITASRTLFGGRLA